MEGIDGLIKSAPRVIFHPKGDILHVIKASDLAFLGFGEAYFSSVLEGQIKAWKKHLRMTLTLVVPQGTVRFVFVDQRPGSATFGSTQTEVCGRDSYLRLSVPPGIWMGFKGLDHGVNLILNIANIEHDPSEQVNIPYLESSIQYDWGSA